MTERINNKDLGKMSPSAFLTYQIENPAPIVEVEEWRIEHFSEGCVLVNCEDGTFFGSKCLDSLEKQLGKSVVVVSQTNPQPIPGTMEGRASAYITDLLAASIASQKLYNLSIKDPARYATHVARKVQRFSGHTRKGLMEEFSAMEVNEEGFVNRTVTIIDYLTDYSLHTPESQAWVREARLPETPEDIKSLAKIRQWHPEFFDEENYKPQAVFNSFTLEPALVGAR